MGKKFRLEYSDNRDRVFFYVDEVINGFSKYGAVVTIPIHLLPEGSKTNLMAFLIDRFGSTQKAEFSDSRYYATIPKRKLRDVSDLQ